jgi:translin
VTGSTASDRLADNVEAVRRSLEDAHRARESALPGCRRVIQLSGSAIKCVHRLQPDRAAAFADEADDVLRGVQAVLAGHPASEHGGFLHDAEKEYVEARSVIALVAGAPLPSADDLGVGGPAYLRGVAEAASELRRHLLDRLRDGDLARGEELLSVMDHVYETLGTVDFPDAVTGGLRRTLDALRAVLERSRGDLTTTVLQARLQRALEAAADAVADSGSG